MGQYWEMIAHKRYQTMGCWGKIGESIQSGRPARVIPLLAVPVRDDYMCGRAPAHQSPQVYSRLLHLPVDILLLITDELDLDSLYMFSNCCWLLHNLLRNEVSTCFRQTLAPWKKTPLICAGDCMVSNPPGITTQVPKDFAPDPEINDNLQPEKYSELTVYHILRHIHAANILHLCPCFDPLLFVDLWPGVRYRYKYNIHPCENILKMDKYFPPGRRWVLRNHTTKENVYAHVFTSRDGTGSGDDSPDARSILGFSLGTLVFVNICWSDDDCTSMYGLDVRDRWAGHCFDIVEEAKLLRNMKPLGEVWVDVSFREYSAMVQLFKMNEWPDR